MSGDKYPCIFLRQKVAIVYLTTLYRCTFRDTRSETRASSRDDAIFSGKSLLQELLK